MSQHHRADITRFLVPTIANRIKYAREKPTHAIFRKGLSRNDARILAKRRVGREVRQFFYDARNGRASWL